MFLYFKTSSRFDVEFFFAVFGLDRFEKTGWVVEKAIYEDVGLLVWGKIGEELTDEVDDLFIKDEFVDDSIDVSDLKTGWVVVNVTVGSVDLVFADVVKVGCILKDAADLFK